MDSNEPPGDENTSLLGDHGNVAARATTSASESASASSFTEGATPTAAAAAAAPADGTPVIASPSLPSPSVPSQFPDKLMALLEKKVATDAVWWLRDMGAVTGAFAINRKVFSEKLLDVAFNGNKFPSITRNLNRWGYKQISYPNLPAQTTAYFNPLFQRNRPDLLKIMVKDKSKAKAAIQQFEMKMAQKSTSVTLGTASSTSVAASSNSGDHGQYSRDSVGHSDQKSLRDSLLQGQAPGQSINLIRSAAPQASPIPANPRMLSLASNLRNSNAPNQESSGWIGGNQPMGIGNNSEISMAGLMSNSNNPGIPPQQLPESVLLPGATGVTNINGPAEDTGFVDAQALLHSLLTHQDSVDNLAKQLEEQQGSCLWPSSQQGVSLSSQSQTQPPQQQSGGRHRDVLQQLQHQEDMLRGQLELGQQRQRQQELQQQFELQQRQQREQHQQVFNRQQEAHLLQLRQNFLRLQEQQQEEMQHQQLDPLLVPLQRNEQQQQQQVQLQQQFPQQRQHQQEEEQKMQREHQQQQLHLLQLSQQFHQQRQVGDLAQQQQQHQLGQGLLAGGLGSLSNSAAEDPTSAIVAAAATSVAHANNVTTSRLNNEELSYQQQQAILQEIFRRQQQQRQQE